MFLRTRADSSPAVILASKFIVQRRAANSNKNLPGKLRISPDGAAVPSPHGTSLAALPA
jgi:hypothetical protein